MNKGLDLLFGILLIFFAGFYLLLFWGCASEKKAKPEWAFANRSEAIIIDHSCTDINQIPEDWIKKAIEADNRNGMWWNLGRDYALYAEFFKRKGDQLKAKENLNKAIEILRECGADGWVEKYEKELAVL